MVSPVSLVLSVTRSNSELSEYKANPTNGYDSLLSSVVYLRFSLLHMLFIIFLYITFDETFQ